MSGLTGAGYIYAVLAKGDAEGTQFAIIVACLVIAGIIWLFIRTFDFLGDSENYSKEYESIDPEMVSFLAQAMIVGAGLCEQSFDSGHASLKFGKNVVFVISEDSCIDSLVSGMINSDTEVSATYNLGTSDFPFSLQTYREFLRSLGPMERNYDGGLCDFTVIIKNLTPNTAHAYYNAVQKALKTTLSERAYSKLKFNGSMISIEKSE